MIRKEQAVYHLTSRTNNSEWFALPLSAVWRLFEERLGALAERHGTLLHAFVLMSNHFHLLLTAPNLNVDAFTRELLTGISKAIGRCAQRTNHVFGGRYKWSLATNSFSASIMYKYVYRNPVRAGLCENVEDYPYSTLGQLLRGDSQIPVVDRLDNLGRFARMGTDECLRWLNTRPPSEHEELIRKGLRRYQFQLSESNEHRKTVEELKTTYVPAMLADDRYLLGLKGE